MLLLLASPPSALLTVPPAFRISRQHSDYGSITLLTQWQGQGGLEVKRLTHVARIRLSSSARTVSQGACAVCCCMRCVLRMHCVLQACRPDGEWISVPPVEGGIIVNIGDCMMRWSNDVLRSTPHRILDDPRTDGETACGRASHRAPPPSALQSAYIQLSTPAVRCACCLQASERYSIAFFCNPNKETLVECIPGCSSEDNPYKYKPMTAGDYITMRLSGTIEH